MTEAEWWVSIQPFAMLDTLRRLKRTARRERLLNGYESTATEARILQAVGEAVAAVAANEPAGTDPVRQAAVMAWSAVWSEDRGSGKTGFADSWNVVQNEARQAADQAARTAAFACLADELRCVFGNPHRRAAFDPAWRTMTVAAIAEGVYADRAFDRLPVLADALEDAGCDNDELLAHLRGPGPHARGCWALDLVLGKA